jgi:hypothetical protein
MSERMKKRRARLTNRSSGRVIEVLEDRLLLAIINNLTDPLTGPGVDANNWTITDRGLENNGPVGYNAPTEDATGLTLGGTTNSQYWYGSSLESVGDFDSHATTTVSVDRVSLAGTGSAWRSSLWLFQPGGQFLHFAQDVNETGWQYNQTAGNVGTGIGLFNTTAGNGGLHTMKLIYAPGTGATVDVAMYLDGALGATAHFTNWDHNVPFKVILTGQARAAGDSVSAVFKNLSAVADPIPTNPPAAPSNLTATAAAHGLGATLTWLDNANNEVNFHVERSTDGVNFTEVAIAPAAAGSGTTVTYQDTAPAAATKFYYRVRAFNNANGGSFSNYSNVQFTTTAQAITSLVDPLTGNGVDLTKWDITNRGLENNAPAGYNAPVENAGGLTLGGTTNSQYWYGSSLESKDVFSSQLTTTVSVDRVSLSGTGSAWRSSLWLLQPTANGQFLHFSQNVGESNWQYNQTGGGGGTGIGNFAGITDGGLHNMKLVYTPLGRTTASVDIYLDGALGATATFTNWDTSVPFKVILTGQARAIGDSASAVFQNFSAVTDPLPTPPVAPTDLTATVSGQFVNLQWTDNADNELFYSVERSIDGTNYTQLGTVDPSAGTGSTMTFTDGTVVAGTTYFYRVRAYNYAALGTFSPSNIANATIAPPVLSVVDPLTGNSVDATIWDITNRGLENNGPVGYNDPTEDSTGVTLGGTTSAQYWYGKSLETKAAFSSATMTTVSVDRVFLLGSGSAYRSSLWLLQPGTGQFLHFSQNVNETNWQYNQSGGGSGTAIAAFANIMDGGLHTMKLVYTALGGMNANVDIYLDGVLGTSVAFNNWDNSIPFRVILTGQARAAGDSVAAEFKNFSAVSTAAVPAVILGTANADTILLKRNADGVHADVTVNGSTQQLLLSTATPVQIQSLAGDDVLTVDYTAGNPVPAGGLTFDGGNGNDTLKVIGAGATTDAAGLVGLSLQHLGGGILSAATNVENLALGAAAFATPSLTIGGAGNFQSVDLGSSTLRVLYTGPTPAATLRGYLTTGRAGGAWNGPGIRSSAAAANAGFALGYADVGGIVTIRYTRTGDANLDGTVNFTDLVALAQHYGGTGGQIWTTGDFTYDNNVDFTDLVALAQNYNQSAPAATPVGASVSASPVQAAATAASVKGKIAAPAKVAAVPAVKPKIAVARVPFSRVALQTRGSSDASTGDVLEKQKRSAKVLK